MSDRDAELKAVVKSIYDDMVEDFLLTIAVGVHRHYKRSHTVCGTCGTNCRSHLPLNSSSSSSSLNVPNSARDGSNGAPSRTSSPQPPSSQGGAQDGKSVGYTSGPEKGTGGSTGIGSGSGRLDSSGNAFFECLVCGRAIASTRYAPHLSSCLGLNGSTRRGAARSAAAKARLGNNDRSSPSPYLQSENGDSDADSNSGKRKKTLNGNFKRGRSPSKPPNVLKKSKYSSGTATPVSSASRPVLPPSKLGRPPKNRSPANPPSPSSISSPEYSIVSSQGTGTSGMVGRKTLPGQSLDTAMLIDDQDAHGEYVPDDESSEGPDDY